MTETMAEGRDAPVEAGSTRDTGNGPGAGEEGTGLALKLWTVLSRAQGAVADHSLADIRRHELTRGEFGVLEALYHKGPLLLGALREKTLVSSGGVTYLVDRLAERGLVEREPCPDDRRASYAGLTDDGRDLVERIFPAHARAMERAVSGLSDDEKRRAVRLLKKLGHRAAALEPLEEEDGAAAEAAPQQERD